MTANNAPNCAPDDTRVGSGAHSPRRAPRDRAVACLRDRLAAGPVPATRLFEEARAAGISVGTLRRAKAELNVVARQAGIVQWGPWRWYLTGSV